MKKKITLLLCGFLVLSTATAAVVVQNTTTTVTESQPDGIAIGTYEVSESPMSAGEAAWALSRASAVVAMDMDSATTVSEQSFALSSLIYKTDKSEALNTLREIFYNAPSNEARVYALMGIYAIGDTSEFNGLYNSINKDDTLVAIVSGKPYTVSIEKFFATFKKNPQMFLPTSFPPKNLSFEKAVSAASKTSSESSKTTTTTTSTSVSFTTFPSLWYSDIIYWNAFARPVIIFSHHKRPHHFRPRPLPPRPLPIRPPHNPNFRPKPVHPQVFYKPVSGKPKFGSGAKGVKNRAPQSGALTNLNLGKKNAKPDAAQKPSPKIPAVKTGGVPAQNVKRPNAVKSSPPAHIKPSAQPSIKVSSPTGSASFAPRQIQPARTRK